MAKKKAESVVEVDESESKSKSRFQNFLVSETLTALTKKYGSSVLMRASDDRHQEVSRISSGIFMLDYALGGGWAAGRMHTIFGMKSSGKTTTLTKTMVEAQKMCANCFSTVISFDGEVLECKCKKYRETVCAFVDVEGTFDHKWAQKLGLDLDRVLYSKPEYAEQSLDITEALLRSGEVDVLILDSLAFLTPMSEVENSVEKETMGGASKLIGKAIRKLNSGLNTMKNETGRLPTIFFTNQIRNKITMFGDPNVQPGGFAPGFAATTEVKVSPGKYEMDEITGKPLHADLSFKIEKNKAGPPKMEGSFRLILHPTDHKKVGEIYEEDKMVAMAQQYGLVEGHGNSWRCLGEQYGAKSLIEKQLLADKSFKKKLGDALMAVLLAA